MANNTHNSYLFQTKSPDAPPSEYARKTDPEAVERHRKIEEVLEQRWIKTESGEVWDDLFK